MFNGGGHMMGEIDQVEVYFSGDLIELKDFNRKLMSDYVNSFIQKYGKTKEFFDVDIYLKKFEASSFGRPLIFCSIAANTEFGLLSTTSTGWGVKQSLRQGLKILMLEQNKLIEKEVCEGVEALA